MDCAQLLRTARWQAGLTQAEVAARAGTSQQALARYERGHAAPSIAVLERLLAANGMRLRAALEPEPGLEDEPTRHLLDTPPMDRLPQECAAAIPPLTAALADHGLACLLAGKSAARLIGAAVRVWHLELWLDRATRMPLLLRALEAAGASEAGGAGRHDPVTSDLTTLTDELACFHSEADVRLVGVWDFDRSLARALHLPVQGRTVLVVPPDEVAVLWHPRDRDRLAVQRAVRLREERATPDQV